MARPKGSLNTQPSSDAKRELMKDLRYKANGGDTLVCGLILIIEALHYGKNRKERPRG